MWCCRAANRTAGADDTGDSTRSRVVLAGYTGISQLCALQTLLGSFPGWKTPSLSGYSQGTATGGPKESLAHDCGDTLISPSWLWPSGRRGEERWAFRQGSDPVMFLTSGLDGALPASAFSP